MRNKSELQRRQPDPFATEQHALREERLMLTQDTKGHAIEKTDHHSNIEIQDRSSCKKANVASHRPQLLCEGAHAGERDDQELHLDRTNVCLADAKKNDAILTCTGVVNRGMPATLGNTGQRPLSLRPPCPSTDLALPQCKGELVKACKVMITVADECSESKAWKAATSGLCGLSKLPWTTSRTTSGPQCNG